MHSPCWGPSCAWQLWFPNQLAFHLTLFRVACQDLKVHVAMNVKANFCLNCELWCLGKTTHMNYPKHVLLFIIKVLLWAVVGIERELCLLGPRLPLGSAHHSIGLGTWGDLFRVSLFPVSLMVKTMSVESDWPAFMSWPMTRHSVVHCSKRWSVNGKGNSTHLKGLLPGLMEITYVKDLSQHPATQ